MPVYRIALHGITTPLLVRDESAAKAKDQILDLKALTTEEMADALAAGETIYRAGESVLGKDARIYRPSEDKEGLERVDLGTGMLQRRTGPGQYEDDRPATITELQDAFGGGTVAVDPASGMVRHLKDGADSETGWHDIREATPDEIAAAEPPPTRAKK